jgi:hypothetical protein
MPELHCVSIEAKDWRRIEEFSQEAFRENQLSGGNLQ